jgi:hypothetical protein
MRKSPETKVFSKSIPLSQTAPDVLSQAAGPTEMRKEIIMKALSPLPLKKKRIAKPFTAYTYAITVDNAGTVSNHPSYVRVGDHVTWTIENVVPSSVTITFLSPAKDFFTSVSRVEDTVNKKVVYTASTVKAAKYTKIKYYISGTPAGPFTTPTMELMADDSGKPPGFDECPTIPGDKPPHPVHPRHPRLKAADRGPGPGGNGAPDRRAVP